MPPRSLLTLIPLGVVGACYSPPEVPIPDPLGRPEAAVIRFQAVDAGTGDALSDPELTVRYLVRAPIMLDVSAVEQVSSLEPYEIRHVIQVENLVVEVRLEAPSYHQLDTVLTVSRGSSAGPLTMRMSRRLDRVARADPPPVEEPETPPPAILRPGGGRATRPPVNTGPDRSALIAGDQAFARSNWLEATEAYRQMPLPEDATSEYGQDYKQALLKQGVAHMNRAEFGAALEVLEHAASFGSPDFQTSLRLAGAQCAVGRTEEGRGTLAEVGRSMNRMTESRQLLVGALIEYERGLCSHGEFDRAETTRERVRTGAAAIQELQAFIDFGRQIVPIPDQVQPAIADAERRIVLIRRQISG